MQTAKRTDKRVRFMDEIISSVQVIKMYAWEKSFIKLVARSRRMELKVLRKVYDIRMVQLVFTLFTTRMALFCTMLAVVYFHGPHEITAQRIFVISSYFSILAFLMAQRFSRAISEVSECLVALERIQNFLELEEKEIDKNEEHPKMEKESNICISMKNLTARWIRIENVAKQNEVSNDEKHSMPTLHDLNIEFPRGKLIGVVGPTGAGKSSLLQAILRELTTESGSISIDGKISYACQEPWIFAASVRQNILFGQEYDHNRYNSIVRTCALSKDFKKFEHGDLTIVGERGTSLSGGQKARIK